MFFDFLFLGIIYVGITIHESRDKIYDRPFLIAIFLIVFIGQKIGTYRTNEAKILKTGKSEFKKDHLSFLYDSIKVATNDSTLFIGETSSYIFLYNIRDSVTSAYPFSKIENLKIK
jgi:hypothetical protein